MIDATLLGMGVDGARTMAISVKSSNPDKSYAFTASKLEHGFKVGVSDSPDILAERWNGESWSPLDDVQYVPTLLNFKKTTKPQIIADYAILEFFFPIDVPGRYKLTLFFREYETDSLSTVGDMLDISFEVEIPEADGSRYNLYSVYTKYVEETGAGIVELLIKSGDEMTHLYLDIESIDALGKDAEILYVRPEQKFFRDICEWNDQYCHYGVIGIPEVDRAETCPLTLHFTENPDGSGEQYTLTLNLRFDE